MTREEVLALIQEQLAESQKGLEETLQGLFEPVALELTQNVQTYLGQVTGSLEDRLAAVESQTDKTGKTDKTADPLADRLAELERQLAEQQSATQAKEQEASKLRFQAELSGLVDGFKPVQKELALEVLASRLAGVQETEAGFLLDGKSLAESVKGFFETEAGRHLLPPTAKTNGVGVAEGKAKAPATTDVMESLTSAFL